MQPCHLAWRFLVIPQRAVSLISPNFTTSSIAVGNLYSLPNPTSALSPHSSLHPQLSPPFSIHLLFPFLSFRPQPILYYQVLFPPGTLARLQVPITLSFASPQKYNFFLIPSCYINAVEREFISTDKRT